MTKQTTAGAEAPASEAMPAYGAPEHSAPERKQINLTPMAAELKLQLDALTNRLFLRVSEVEELTAFVAKQNSVIEAQAAEIAGLRAKKPKANPADEKD